MASRYTALPEPSAGDPRSAPHDHINGDYELRNVHGSERERYEPFTSAPNIRLSSTEDRHYQSKTVTDPMSKTAATSAMSLTSQHNLSKTYTSDGSKPPVRSTVISWLPELVAVLVKELFDSDIVLFRLLWLFWLWRGWLGDSADHEGMRLAIMLLLRAAETTCPKQVFLRCQRC